MATNKKGGKRQIKMDDVYENSLDSYPIDEIMLKNETDGWNIVQMLFQSVAEIFSKVESSIDNNSFNCFSQNPSSTEMDDINKVEELLENFKVSWMTQSQEMEHLRQLVNRLKEEKSISNERYHNLKEHLTKIHHKLEHADDSNVASLHETSNERSTRSERLGELETTLRDTHNHFKERIERKLLSDPFILSSAEEWINKLKGDTETMDQMLLTALSHSRHNNESSSVLASEKRKIMIHDGYAGVIASLKQELEDLQKIENNHRNQIDDFETVNTDPTDDQLFQGKGCEKQIEDLYDILHKIKINHESDVSGLTAHSPQGDIQLIKRMISDFTDHMMIFRTYISNKINESIHLKDSNDFLRKNLENMSFRVSTLEHENQGLKTHLDLTERNYELSVDELNIIQKRVISIERERNTCLNELVALKDGQGTQSDDQCLELNEESKKIIDTIRQVELEREKLFQDLDNQIKKTNEISSEYGKLKCKCDNYEQVVSKLKYEYGTIARELNNINSENEELTKYIQDFEREYMIVKRKLKSSETNNKDLEDQLFQLTKENHKLSHNYKRIESNIGDYMSIVKNLEGRIESSEIERKKLENYQEEVKIENMEVNCITDGINDQFLDKTLFSKKKQTILLGYEKLLTKLLYQRKEIINSLNLQRTEELAGNTSLTISTLESADDKVISEFDSDLKRISMEVDSSYNILQSFIESSESDWNLLEQYYKELLHCVNTIDDKDEDSCYSTGYESTESTVHYLRRDIKSAGYAETIATNDCKNIGNIVDKIKVLVKYSSSINRKRKRYKNKQKSKKSRRLIHQLQSRMRNRKFVENSRKNRLIYLSRKLKCSKLHHNTSRRRSICRDCDYFNDGNVTLFNRLKEASVGSQSIDPVILGENVEDIENELKALLLLVSKILNKKARVRIFTMFRNILARFSTIYTAVLTANKDKSLDLYCEKLSSQLILLTEQKMSLSNHIKLTNERLKLLMKYLKGRRVSDGDETVANVGANAYYSRMRMRRVQDSFKSEEDFMKRTVLLGEKAMSVPDIKELWKDNTFIGEKEESINLIEILTEKIKHVLCEANANGTDMSESTATLTSVGGKNSEERIVDNISVSRINDPQDKFDDSKRESELKLRLDSAQKTIENLSIYLKEREKEIKKRDKVIAALHKEYEDLKIKSTDNANASASKLIITEYADAKHRLEKENRFLQLAVKEIREELENLQKGYRREEEVKKGLQNHITELELCKISLEQQLNEVTSELRIITKDREYLLQSIQITTMRNIYRNTYCRPPYSNEENKNEGQLPYPKDMLCYEGCKFCPENSESSAVPFSDEEWMSANSCDECDSLLSGTEHLDVISSSDSHATSSKLAVNVKTKDVSERIKLKNRPSRYQQKETRTRKPIVPKISNCTIDSLSSGASTDMSIRTTSSIKTDDSRVLGRRETKMGSRVTLNLDCASSRTSSSVKSNNSLPASPVNCRHISSFPEDDSMEEHLWKNENNFNEVDISHLLNPKFGCKKRKKRFLQFGKK